jgi:hypothetical protein
MLWTLTSACLLQLMEVIMKELKETVRERRKRRELAQQFIDR